MTKYMFGTVRASCCSVEEAPYDEVHNFLNLLLRRTFPASTDRPPRNLCEGRKFLLSGLLVKAVGLVDDTDQGVIEKFVLLASIFI